MIKINKGLNVPIKGAPEQVIHEGAAVTRVALIGPDYVGMKPTMLVQEGDTVQQGQALFEDKKNPGVLFASPGTGVVEQVNRGAKRAFESIVIRLEGEGTYQFDSFAQEDLPGLSREQVVDTLRNTGMWPAFRQRPYSKVPPVDAVPEAIFITAMDTNPLAADPTVVLNEKSQEFENGLQVIRHLTQGNVYLCQSPGVKIPGAYNEFLKVEEFAGAHPAGLPGTHINKLEPVSESKTVWHIGYQDVIAIGEVFVTGVYPVERVVALSGPTVSEPRLIRTRIGACLDELVAGQLTEVENRVVSGSVIYGRKAEGTMGYLGRYHLQVSALEEGRQRDLLGWQSPGFKKFSIRKVFASAANPNATFAMTTSTEGSKRAMVPIGMYEDVMPLDIIPTYLLRALLTGDTEQAKALGALELDEEDLALCTFVCPGKSDYGVLLRNILNTIEKDG